MREGEVSRLANKLASKLSGCSGKEQYGSRAAAEKVLKRMVSGRGLKGGGLHVYRCEYCRSFHLGSRT